MQMWKQEVKSQHMLKARGLRAGGQKDQVRSPNQELLDHDLSWRINK